MIGGDAACRVDPDDEETTTEEEDDDDLVPGSSESESVRGRRGRRVSRCGNCLCARQFSARLLHGGSCHSSSLRTYGMLHVQILLRMCGSSNVGP